ncbi:MAG TPA: hypothetical protein VIO36_13705 [Anaerolineaceae bacterium]
MTHGKSSDLHRSASITSPITQRGLGLAARSLLLLWEKPLNAGLLALIVYALAASLNGSIFATSVTPYFNYLADAFLHGQLALRLTPEKIADLVQYNGQLFLYWPPFPAVVLLPFVAIFGVGFSDIAFTLALGALNVVLVAVLLRSASQRLFPLTPVQRAVLVMFFSFGTVHLTLAPRGCVWFTSQLVGLACVLLAYLAALQLQGWKAFLLAGLAMGCAMLTRNNLLFAGLWPAIYLLQQHWTGDRKRLLAFSAVGIAPVLLLGLALLGYNWARFGSFTEIGYQYHNMNAYFASDYQLYGAFNIHYLPTNLYYQYIYYPLPITMESYHGGSLFLMSPLFLAAFWAFAQKAHRSTAVYLLATVMLVNIPILLLMGTGWMTYGPRYTLDFHVPLLLLTAMGMSRWPRFAITIALIVSIATYLFGTLMPFPA